MTRGARTRQRGQFIVLVIMIIAAGTGFLVFSLSGNSELTAQRNAQTDATLLQVKRALIGWSASRTPTAGSPTSRPGELPCPDMNNDGIDNDGGCAAGAIGRVPWKTLEIPEPLDGYGEPIWYSISGPFRYKAQAGAPITSDTLGTLTVYQGSASMTLTSQAIAVLFAPGPLLNGQVRGSDTTAATCSTTGTPTAPQLCAANYLESTGGGNNAQIGGPYIQATASGTFNDRVLPITTADLMPLVEQRVAREIMAYLELYRTRTGVYPWADLSDGNSNAGPANWYNRNRFPCRTAKPTDWDNVTPAITLPDWLTNGCPGASGFVTGWSSVIYYTVAKNRLEGGGSSCTTCSSQTLTVNNPNGLVADLCRTGISPFTCVPTIISSGSADLLLITPGSATASRSAGWSNSSFSAITGYFEDSENSDNNDDNYVVPTSTKYDRNRIYLVR